ncbi:MAG: carboxymuconolactone decarboxylase family protein [Saprospirales bacterium]|nr:MAG: carboxymuconolactone decarboxylase family protein [Saprospirales bacterium]
MVKPLIPTASEEFHPDLEALIKFYNETLGFCPNSVKTMYHRPAIAKAFIEMNKAVMENKGSVTSDLKRLVGYLSSRVAGCKYCQAHTIRAAERYGASREKLENIWDFHTHPAYSEPERAALEFALQASAQPGEVDEATGDNLRKYWNAGEIVELLGVISLFGFLNRWNDTAGTELEGPAKESAEKWLEKDNWTTGKHSG